MDALVLVLAILLIAALIGWQLARRRAAALQVRLDELAARAVTRRDLESRHTEIESRLAAFEAMAGAAYNALLLVDSQRRVLHLNAAARDLFRPGGPYRAESLIAITREHELDDLLASALASSEEPPVQQLTVQGHPYRVRALRADSGGRVYGILALEDVSELQRLGRARRDMVANISHELRTPITSIRLLVDTLLRGSIRDPVHAEPLIHKIGAETDTLHQMAQELLDLAMIESGRAEFILVPVGLCAIADSAVARLAEMASRSEIAVKNEIPPDLSALADSEQITRVLTNLLHNALKFTPPGGQVTFSAERTRDAITLHVLDTGPGITSMERERIFERFYRADRARKGGGTGLGLAIAKHIVEAHGGRIWAADPPPGSSGAQLCFTLPPADLSSNQNVN